MRSLVECLVTMGFRPGGISSITLTSRSPYIVMARVRGIGVAVAAGFGCLSFPVLLLLMLRALAALGLSKLAMFVLLATPLTLWSLTIYGALKMLRLEALGAALAASIFAMLVPPGNLLGFPIGIWSLVVLARPEVREAFQKRRAALAAAGAGGSARTLLWFWLLAAAPVLAVLVFGLARSSS